MDNLFWIGFVGAALALIFAYLQKCKVMKCSEGDEKMVKIASSIRAGANAYLKHFVDYGMAEGRQGRASFNVYTYRDEHPELWEKFGDNLRGYYLWACGIPQ